MRRRCWPARRNTERPSITFAGLRAATRRSRWSGDQLGGALFSRTGRLAEAEAAFRAAALVEPDNPYVPAALAGVLDAGREAGRGARPRWPSPAALAEHRDSRARAVANDKRPRKWRCRKTNRRRPNCMRRRLNAKSPPCRMTSFGPACILHAEGRFEEARAAFEEAAAVTAQHERPLRELHWYLGDTLARLDRHADAEVQFREEMRGRSRAVSGPIRAWPTWTAPRTGQSGLEETLDALIDAAPTPEGYDAAARLWTIAGEPGRAATLRADVRTRFRGDPSSAFCARPEPFRADTRPPGPRGVPLLWACCPPCGGIRRRSSSTPRAATAR